MNNPRNNRWPILALGGLLIAGSLVGCDSEPQISAERIRPVQSVVVHSGTAALRDRVFTGTAQAGQESRISFNVAGTVKQLPVAVGDTLQPGQLIAALDPATYNVEVQRAKASVAQADAERRNAESEYQRVRQLYANKNASRGDLDAALSRTQSADANHQAMVQSLQLANLNQRYTRLTADSDCSVAAIDVERNENVAAGTQVGVINCGDRWEVEIAVPASLIASFSPDLVGSIQFDALPAQTFSGSVTEVGITGGGATTYPVTLVLEENHPSFRSGLAAEVTFAFAGASTASNTLFLPPAAVGQDEQGAYVFILEPGTAAGVSIARRRAVTVGGISESGLEILEGLADGDRVITAGITAARDGLQVRAD